jgi:hypothetical protein
MSIPEGDASTIKFGTGLAVTDEGSSVIRVDASETALIADLTIDALTSGGFPTGEPNFFDVTGIPGTYSDLVAVVSFHSAEGTTDITFNGSTDDYYYARPYDSRVTGSTILYDTTSDTDNKIRLYPVGPAAGTDRYCQYTILIPGYAWAKTFQIQGVAVGTDTGDLVMVYDLLGGVWLDTAPITRLTVAALGASGFTDGSQLRVYGRT